MAVDGRKLSDTLRLGSDDLCEFPCSPCAKDGKEVASAKHCVECGENLCKTCLAYHEKFTRGHQILDKLSSQTGQKRPELLVQRCDKHGGKLVDVYCPDHDIVGCATCMNVDHSTCKGIQYVSEIASRSQSSKELSKLESTLKHLLVRLDKLKTQNQDNLKQIQREKDVLLKEIRDLRKKINDKLDKIEKSLVNEVEYKFTMKTQAVNQNIENLNKYRSVIEAREKNLEDAKTINDAELFVQLKLGMSNVQETELTLKQVGSDQNIRLTKLVPSKDIVNLLSDESLSFGGINEYSLSISVNYIEDKSIRLPSDKSECDISDACCTTNGNIIITDYKNKCIKKLDHQYAITEHLCMPDYPICLCEVDSQQLAVTLRYNKKVQFAFQQPLKLGKSFSVGDLCRGINYHDGQFYICCGGNRDDGEGPGHIEVYNRDGDLLRSYYEGLKWPNRIIVSNKNDLVITDKETGKAINVNMHSCHVTEMQIKKLFGRLGFCRLGESQLCIAGGESNNVVLISGDGEHQVELLTEKDSIVSPLVICYDEKRSRLLVSLRNSNMIKVFHLVL